MRLFRRRRPDLRRLRRREDVAGLRAALGWRDVVTLRDGQPIDAGAPLRRQAVAALAAVEGEEAGDALADALDDPDEQVRIDAVEALRARGGAPAARALGTAAGSWPPERFEAAHDAAVAALIDHDPGAGADAYVAAVVARRDEPVPERNQEAVCRLLEAMLQGGESPDAVRAVVVAALEGVEPEPAERILTLLGPELVEPMIALLSEPGRRALAATALGLLHDRRALDPLTDHVDDHDAEVRRAVVVALGRLKDPMALGTLLRASRDDVYEVRAAALAALDAFGAVAVAAGLVAAAQPAALGSMLGVGPDPHGPALPAPRVTEGLIPRLRRALDSGA